MVNRASNLQTGRVPVGDKTLTTVQAWDGWQLRCPICHASLMVLDTDHGVCTGNEHKFERVDGVWRLLPESRSAEYARFVSEYETVRRFEGRQSDSPEFYRALPFKDLTGQFSDDWRIRAISFRALIERIVKPLENRYGRPLKVLDLGAGNCWLSNRLAERGHSVAAVDLLTNSADGLGANRFYDTTFTTIQAEFDRLPFESGQADLAIFNGSIHYSTDFNVSLTEALRVLQPDGKIVILDSPVYHDPKSGDAMVKERESRFIQDVGFPSNALPMEHYLTSQRLGELSRQLGIAWSTHEPFYGMHWFLKPWVARVRRLREPAKFLLISGSRNANHVQFKRTIRRRASRSLLRVSKLWKARAQRRISVEHVAGLDVVVLPGVFNPRLLRSGEFFASQLTEEAIPACSRVLDLGTGSGIAAIASARWAREVVAVDINPIAVRCARANALINGVENNVTVLQGDLFQPVAEERFDLILFNPPFYRGVPRDLTDFAWRSPDVVSRFAAEVRQHLTENGSALVILSTDGEEEKYLADLRANGLDVRPTVSRDLSNEIFTVYRLTDSTRAEYDRTV